MHFFGDPFATQNEFGGSLLGKSHPKTARPLSTKQAMHVVLRSSLAVGKWSLRAIENIKIVERTVRKLAQKHGIKVYKFANVGNHIHLLIRLGHRFSFAPFIRALTGIIAAKVTGTRKKSPLKEYFWDFRPWSRIVEWGNAYAAAKSYVIQNEMEATGQRPYGKRRRQAPKRATVVQV